MKYNFSKIEKYWQQRWDKEAIYQAADKGKKEKKYVLIEFPYPSGEGLHMGHLRPYVAGDVYSRFLRMRGYEVLYPIGWDAFGLPAENYAIKRGVQPAISTAKNVENAKRQLKSWGIGFDWSREINTTDPNYYKWTQWIFLQFWKAGLAYEAEGIINWCPKDKTGLANEEVINSRCERCGTLVEKKKLRQWYLKITAYAEKLLNGLKALDWPEQIKIQQENWIGKSKGAEIDFEIRTDKKPNFVLLHGYGGSPKRNFFPWLKKELEKRGYKVQAPLLPHSDKMQANEEDDSETIRRKVKFDRNTIVVAHSLGTIVAMKAIQDLKTPIRRLVLVGGFLEPEFKDHQRPFANRFNWEFDFKKIRNNADKIIILQDINDHIIPAIQGKKLRDALGGELIEAVAQETHFCAALEPAVLHYTLENIPVFTTRPDTLFGATYLILAPEHPLVENLESRIQNLEEIRQYVKKTKLKTEEERIAENKDKSGVKLKGIKAINPANGKEISVWIADYVLSGYGTGAIMAVPAHDKRDYEFAKKYELPIKMVICPNYPAPVCPVLDRAYEGDGCLVGSGKFDGMESKRAKQEITKFVGGQKRIRYRLRDWVFSRQRYWGEPIPLIHCKKCGIVPVPEKDLPVKLPEVKKYEPTGTGESPLAAVTSWVNTKCPKCGELAKRETNTMPQWAGSSWYYLRYVDPKNNKEFASEKLLKRWLPVDVYFGGFEHTTLHLLYSRFWHLFLRDKKLVSASEPYLKRVPHGIILGPDGEKMSKSRGNVVNPDEIIKNFGADCLRMYEMFLGPHEATVSWQIAGILGIERFMERVWKLYRDANIQMHADDANKNLERLLHQTIKKVTEDIENFHWNTAISALMILLNEIEKRPSLKIARPASLGKAGENWKLVIKLLAPFAPHLAEEIWRGILGHKTSVHREPWPTYDPKFLVADTFMLVIQINGKMRDSVEALCSITDKEARNLALQREKIKNIVGGKEVKRVIYIPQKLVNLVV